MTTKPYKTLFTGELVQCSALSVGGADVRETVDDPFARDGLDRPILRGSGWAGALVATARRLCEVPVDIAHQPIDASGRANKRDMSESLWRFYHAHTVNPDPSHEYRQNVGFSQDTGAAADGGLFDVETLPAGTRWWLCLEVDTWRDDSGFAEALAATALLEWTHARCWMGRSPARGMGWMRLENARAIRLNCEQHLRNWPRASYDDQAAFRGAVEALATVPGVTSHELSELAAGMAAAAARFAPRGRRQQPRATNVELRANPSRYLRLSGTFKTGPYEIDDGNGVREQWGLDTLSVGGHAANLAAAAYHSQHFLAAQGMKGDAAENAFVPDFTIVMTGSGADAKPYVPGSAYRGPLRHALSRSSRIAGKKVYDPAARESVGTGSEDADIDTLFGFVKEKQGSGDADAESGVLMVRDAYLVDDQWTAVWLQKHAEDEFTQGVYGDSKFDRVVLVAGKFAWQMVIEFHPWRTNAQDRVDEWRKSLEHALAMGRRRRLPLGGGQWRGHGWVEWSLDKVERADAGNDWQSVEPTNGEQI